jgi:hypothetical protein
MDHSPFKTEVQVITEGQFINHIGESDIEKELRMRPTAGVTTTGVVLTPGTGVFEFTGYPVRFIVGRSTAST